MLFYTHFSKWNVLISVICFFVIHYSYWVSLYKLNIFRSPKQSVYFFPPTPRGLKSFTMDNKVSFILHRQWHCCQWAGEANSNWKILTHWGRDKMPAIIQTTFSNAFFWMKMYEFRLTFHWSLFLRVQLTIFHHRFRYWLCAGQATSHYLNQLWLVYWRIYASLGLSEWNNFNFKHVSVFWISFIPH